MKILTGLVSIAFVFARADALAQERGIELQGGAGYVFDNGEGPSVPATHVAAIGWLTRGWGIGARLANGLADDAASASVVNGDLRVWALTSQWRWIVSGTEVNFGFGAGGHGYRYKSIENGQRIASRSGSGFIAMDLLVGRHLSGPFHVKGGFTYGLSDDLHPFQPIVLVAWNP